MKIRFAAVMMFVAVFFCAARVNGQIYIPTNDPPYYGPYNGSFWAGGDELKKHLVKGDTLLRARALVEAEFAATVDVENAALADDAAEWAEAQPLGDPATVADHAYA